MIPPASITADDAFELGGAGAPSGACGGGMAGGGGGGCTPFILLGEMLLAGGDGETMCAPPTGPSLVTPLSSTSIGSEVGSAASIVEVEAAASSASCGAARCCCCGGCFFFLLGVEPPPFLDFFFDRLPIAHQLNST